MKNRAFTLIELLVVVLIIGILAAIAIPQYQKAVLRSRFAQMVLSNDALVKAQKLYFLANNKYANSKEELDIDIVNTPNVSCAANWYEGSLCYLRNNNGSTIAVLEETYSTGKKICCAYQKTSFVGAELCQIEMNNTEYYQGCGSVDGCHCYRSK